MARPLGRVRTKLVAKRLKPRPIAISIGKSEELMISSMGIADSQRMCDRAPILLGPAANLPNIADKPVAISAEHAVQRLYSVQVGKVLEVKNNIFSSSDMRDPIRAKSDCLIDGNPDVGQKQWDDQRVYNRSGDDWCER
jgi:hypothetical protein